MNERKKKKGGRENPKSMKLNEKKEMEVQRKRGERKGVNPSKGFKFQ